MIPEPNPLTENKKLLSYYIAQLMGQVEGLRREVEGFRLAQQVNTQVLSGLAQQQQLLVEAIAVALRSNNFNSPSPNGKTDTTKLDELFRQIKESRERIEDALSRFT